jgi:hypothetical protein
VRAVLIWSAAVVVVASTSTALAAAFGITTSKLGVGTTPVLSCDANGFTETYTTLGGIVATVTVGGIADPACEGGALRLTLTDAGGDSIASAGPLTVPADGDTADNSLTFPSVSPQPGAAQVTRIHISVSGP